MAHGQDPILPVDYAVGGDADMPGPAQPVTQDEIDDLLHGSHAPVAERLERLRALRADLAESANRDLVESDSAALLIEIDQAIGRLRFSAGEPIEGFAEDRDAESQPATRAPDDEGSVADESGFDRAGRTEVEDGAGSRAPAREEQEHVEEASEDLDDPAP